VIYVDEVGVNPSVSSIIERKQPVELPKSKDDEELLKFIQEEDAKHKIYIVGSGGSGTNTLDRLFEMGVNSVNLVAMNTDAKHLLKVRANKKILLGKKLSGGRGAGSNPQIGEESAKESIEEIKAALKDCSMVFITCGMGGGTGTGSAPVIAEVAKSMGALTVAVVTLPFSSEGKIRLENAMQGLEKHLDFVQNRVPNRGRDIIFMAKKGQPKANQLGSKVSTKKLILGLLQWPKKFQQHTNSSLLKELEPTKELKTQIGNHQENEKLC
jgi:hypothetical protein